MKKLKFIDLFAGLGGFHLALADLGHKCVFASELNEELRELYEKNHLEVWQEFLNNLGVPLSGRALQINPTPFASTIKNRSSQHADQSLVKELAKPTQQKNCF